MPSNNFTAYPNLLDPSSPTYAISPTPFGPDSALALDLLDPFPSNIHALVQPDTATTQPTSPQTSSPNTPSNIHGTRIASTNPTSLRHAPTSALPNNTISTPAATSIATFAPNTVPAMTMAMTSGHFNTEEMSSLRAMIQRREARRAIARAKRNVARAKIQRLVLEKTQDGVENKGQDTKVLEEGVGSMKLD